jgi:peptidoglycan/LPS O-acetylase OafA/YrhL
MVLRGIAALLVIYLHLADYFLHTEPNLGALEARIDFAGMRKSQNHFGPLRIGIQLA